MPDLAVQSAVRAGLEATYTGSITASTDYTSPNDGATILHFKNAATAASVSITTFTVVDGINLADRVVAIPANEERFIGPFPPSIYGNTLTWQATSPATLSVAAIRVAQ